MALVAPSDPGYREFCSERAQSSRRLRDSLLPSDSQVLSNELEAVFGQWIEQHLGKDERRILAFERYNPKKNQYLPGYRELDAVAWTEEDRLVIVEFKASGNPKSVEKAKSQLRESAAILSCRYSPPRTVAVWCDTGEGAAEADLDVVDLETLEVLISSMLEDESAHRVSANDLWQWGASHGLLSDPDLMSRVAADAQVRASKRARRRSLIEQGVPKEEWPDDLVEANAEVPESYVASFGSEGPSDSFASSLRKALNLPEADD